MPLLGSAAMLLSFDALEALRRADLGDDGLALRGATEPVAAPYRTDYALSAQEPGA